MRHPDLPLADRFVAANIDLMHLLTGATDSQLALITPEEGWSVLLVAHHVALAFLIHSAWVRQVAAGEAVTTTRAQLDVNNAQMVHDASSLTRTVVLAELQTNGTSTEALLHSLSMAQRSSSAPLAVIGNRTMTVETVITQIVLGHFADHVPHMRAILAQAAVRR